MTGEALPAICARVFDVLVEGGEVTEAELVEHLHSCMRCFRHMTELRDVPRLAAALRADAPILPESEELWDRLARRALEASSAALTGAEVRVGAEGGEAPSLAHRPSKRTGALAAGFVAAVAVAAAAVVLLAPRHHEARSPIASAKSPGASGSGLAMSPGDEPWAAADVSDLDRAALRRLLDRLGASAPGALAGSVRGDSADLAETFGDDDARVNDELAELDGPALLRVAHSFERPRL